MNMPWPLLAAIAVLGYLQRTVPWVLAGRTALPPGLTQWLRFVAPAAFAVLTVTDLARPAPASFIALGVSAAISWRTRNLGLAVLTAIAVIVAAQIPGGGT